MAKTPKKKISNEPFVEVRIYVEKSVIDACGGIDNAKIEAYWHLVDLKESTGKTKLKN